MYNGYRYYLHRNYFLDQFLQLLETFRFLDENGNDYEIWFKVFFATVKKKIDTSESFIVLFFARLVSTAIFITRG